MGRDRRESRRLAADRDGRVHDRAGSRAGALGRLHRPHRHARRTPETFHLLYGNRGNVDVLGVPIVIGLPRDFEFEARVAVVPPPDQPGLPPIDWSRVPITMGSPLLPGVQAISLLLPAVPAGFTGTIEIQLRAGTAAVGRAWELPFAIGEPYAGSPDAVARLVAGARAYARRVLDVGISRDRIAEMEAVLTAQLEEILRIGLHRLLVGAPEPRAVPHLVVGLAAAFGSAAEVCTDEVDNDGDALIDEADPDCQAEDDESDDDEEEDDEEDDDDEEECEPEEAENPWYGDDDCDGEPDCKEGGFNTCAPEPCTKWPPTACGGTPPRPTVLNSHDPNDKVGSVGAGDGHFVTGVDPLRYAVQFENLPAATAPAQDVVISDPLDPTTMDLATLSLGPIGFDDRAVVPPPGLSSFTTDVDLRPEQNLLVRIEASLDAATSVLTWRFTSLDPDTGEPPTDPLAGFLPPNLNPPEGQGSVSFTVDPVGSLPTGTEIRNQASIVFDLNEPIVTPEWLNTIDLEDPVSQVVSAVAAEVLSGDPGELVRERSGLRDRELRRLRLRGRRTVHGVAERRPRDVGHVRRRVGQDLRVLQRGARPDRQRRGLSAGGRCRRHRRGLWSLGPRRDQDHRPEDREAERPQARSDQAGQGPDPEPQRSRADDPEPRHAARSGLARGRVARRELSGADAGPPLRQATEEAAHHVGAKQKLTVAYEVPFGCASDPAQSTGSDPGHEDFEFRAGIEQSVLGGADAFPADDLCPRTVAPPGVVVPTRTARSPTRAAA